jgi:hypothetical protein
MNEVGDMSGLAEIIPGIYEHFKGGRYLVLGVARWDETEEPMVVYVRLYSRPGPPMSVRRVASFGESVETPSGVVPRFRFLGLAEPGGPQWK